MTRLRGAGLAALALLLSAGSAAADDLRFPVQGFTIAPLEAASEGAVVQALIMMLPPTEGFSPNVNVMVQPYQGSLEDYIALSEGQFAGLKFKVLKRQAAETSVTWEYTGTSGGHALHWYARAVRTGGKVYLVTATARKGQWSGASAALKACVDSFALTNP